MSAHVARATRRLSASALCRRPLSASAARRTHAAAAASPLTTPPSLPRYLPSLVDFSRCADADATPAWRAAFPLLLRPDFISAAEEAALLAAVEPALSRRAFEADHWDAVIVRYRELQLPLSSLGAVAAAPLRRALALFALAPGAQAPQTLLHALELAADGEIRSHVDSVKFGGAVVCGISLLSAATLRLTEEGLPAGAARAPRVVDVRLPPRSLYMLHGASRYDFGHAVLTPGARRISIILRDEPPPPAPADATSPAPAADAAGAAPRYGRLASE